MTGPAESTGNASYFYGSLPSMELSRSPSNTSTQRGEQRMSSSIGVSRRKRHIDKHDLLAVTGSLLCLVAACIAVSPATSIPWKLGLTRQFQVLGVLLSLMNQCFLSVAPQFLILIEARFGPSSLQNYDAILRKSLTLPTTNAVWRFILFVLVVLPMGLSLAYKEFDHGHGDFEMRNSTGSYYGLTAPPGLQESNVNGIGLSFMANATLAYYSAARDDNQVPSFPQTYGFNTLVLSNTSSANLDGPLPDYVRSIQERLTNTDSFTVTADVNATVTSYNASIETHRDDDKFWDFYMTQMNDPKDPSKRKVLDEKDLASKILRQALYNSYQFTILMNDLDVRNSSWIFAGFTPAPDSKLDTSEEDLRQAQAFKQNAMLFNTRRERCSGTWLITYNSVLLRNGTCQGARLTDRDQIMFTNTTLAVPRYYIPSMIEYLKPFANERRESPWLLPTFSTVMGGMFWSRTLALNGYYTWGEDKKVDDKAHPEEQPKSNLYYLVKDQVISRRRTMNASWLLYLTLTVQPLLTLLLFLACLSMYSTPIDRGFSMVALLAGIRVETIELLRGASVSGELEDSVRVRIKVKEAHEKVGSSKINNEYILGDKSPNDRLSSG